MRRLRMLRSAAELESLRFSCSVFNHATPAQNKTAAAITAVTTEVSLPLQPVEPHWGRHKLPHNVNNKRQHRTVHMDQCTDLCFVAIGGAVAIIVDVDDVAATLTRHNIAGIAGTLNRCNLQFTAP